MVQYRLLQGAPQAGQPKKGGTMKLKKELNAGVWFDMPDDLDSTRVCLRVLGIGELKKINKETLSKKVEYKKFGRGGNYQRFEYEDPDDTKRDELLWDYCITDWENIFDVDGTALECTLENKVKLMNESVAFAIFVADSLDVLTATQAEKRENEEKN